MKFVDSHFPPEVPTAYEALAALRVIQRYFESQANSGSTPDVVAQLDMSLNSAVFASKRQSTISEYYS